MNRKQIGTAAGGAILAVGVALGAITAADGMAGGEAAPDGSIDALVLMNDRVVGMDDGAFGHVINAYQPGEAGQAFLIVDRGIAHGRTGRFVPVPQSSFAVVDAGTIMVAADAEAFDAAPAYGGAEINDRAGWPEATGRYWADRPAHRKEPLWISQAVRTGTTDLSIQASGYPPADT